ncbi:MAG: DUF3768 domain-containing protein [Pseudomonadota bacterium]
MNRTAIKEEAEDMSAAAQEARAVLIARDNDTFRAAIYRGDSTVAGRSVHTAGVEALGLAETFTAYQKVRDFSEFTEDNDPHGERNFGAFDIAGERLFWKIDYFADGSCEWGSEDPTDPAQVFRVLTIMLASEY